VLRPRTTHHSRHLAAYCRPEEKQERQLHSQIQGPRSEHIRCVRALMLNDGLSHRAHSSVGHMRDSTSSTQGCTRQPHCSTNRLRGWQPLPAHYVHRVHLLSTTKEDTDGRSHATVLHALAAGQHPHTGHTRHTPVTCARECACVFMPAGHAHSHRAVPVCMCHMNMKSVKVSTRSSCVPASGKCPSTNKDMARRCTYTTPHSTLCTGG
jgi:hypothetical protein